MIATEDILFIMPKEREFQFPAMSAVQSYVRSYQYKMRMNCVIPNPPEFAFRYWCDMPDEDWEFFQALGIELPQLREAIGYPDAVIDLSTDRLMAFYNSGKHCAQVCSAITGVEALPYPKVRQVKPDVSMTKVLHADLRFPSGLSDDAIINLHDEAWGCVVLRQGWQSYALVSMGLPVIEILAPHKSNVWFSKWLNPFYRAIEEDKMDRLYAALQSIQEGLAWQSQQEAAGVVRATQMEPQLSLANSAGSSSARASVE